MRNLVFALSLMMTCLFTSEGPRSQRHPAAERAPDASFTCRLVTGYGTATGYGKTKLQAKRNAMLKCGTSIIDDYYARRGKIDPDADLELACINLECS